MHCVTGTWDAQKQVSWRSGNGWGVGAHPFQQPSVHLSPYWQTGPPSLGLWISELSAGRRALGPGDTSYLRYQGLGASTVDT